MAPLNTRLAVTEWLIDAVEEVTPTRRMAKLSVVLEGVALLLAAC